MKNLDIKSFLIGFLFASTLLLVIGASKGTQDVRIVGIDKNFSDWDAIMVETKSRPRERTHDSTPFTRLTTDFYWRIALLSEGVFLRAGEVWIDSESLADMLKAKGLASQRRLSNDLYLNLLSN